MEARLTGATTANSPAACSGFRAARARPRQTSTRIARAAALHGACVGFRVGGASERVAAACFAKSFLFQRPWRCPASPTRPANGTFHCRAGGAPLTGEQDGGEQTGLSFWRGYYHKTGEAPPRLSFAAHWSAVLRTTHTSRVFRAIAKPLAANVALALCVTAAYESGILPFTLASTAHTLLGVPLGLLLVLRITHAQDRFWAGRCAWQALMDTCREGCRRAVMWHSDSPAGRQAASELCGALLAMVAATQAQASCARSMALRHSLEAFTSRELLDSVEAALGTPRSATEVAAVSAAAAINESYRSALLPEFQALELDGTVNRMSAAAGSCECLGRTPTPIEYHCHCTRVLVLFCFSLPLVLAPLHGWAAVLTCTLVSFALMGLDEIASVVEAPFQGYLPLKALWAGLRSDVAAMLAVTTESEDGSTAPRCQLPPQRVMVTAIQ